MISTKVLEVSKKEVVYYNHLRLVPRKDMEDRERIQERGKEKFWCLSILECFGGNAFLTC